MLISRKRGALEPEDVQRPRGRILLSWSGESRKAMSQTEGGRRGYRDRQGSRPLISVPHNSALDLRDYQDKV